MSWRMTSATVAGIWVLTMIAGRGFAWSLPESLVVLSIAIAAAAFVDVYSDLKND